MNWCSRKRELVVFIFFSFILHCFVFCSSAEKMIMEGESIRDGVDEPLTSQNGEFSFGFFSTEVEIQDFRYVGVWYTEKPMPSSVIWVANRDNPILGRNGVITIGSGGNLEVLDGNGAIVWSTNLTVCSNVDTSAELYNSGSLRVQRRKLGLQSGRALSKFVWNSFDHPTDSFLPGMRVYVDKEGEDKIFSSWKSSTDPSIGKYSMGIDSRRSPQIVVWEGEKRVWRSGYWTEVGFTGFPSIRQDYLHGFSFNVADGRRYFLYTPFNSSDELIFRVSWDGHAEHEKFSVGLKQWEMLEKQPADDCSVYNRCGAFGRCDQSSQPICTCLDGFEPSDNEAWSTGDWSGGCIRRTQLQCETNSNTSGTIENQGGDFDGFMEINGSKLPDYLEYVGVEDIKGCEKKCFENCSCLAYAFVSGINCMIWTSDLVDLQHFAEGGYSLFVRISHYELGVGNNKKSILLIVVHVVAGILILWIFMYLATWFMRRRKTKAPTTQNVMRTNSIFPKSDLNSSGGFPTERPGPDNLNIDGHTDTVPELPLYQFNDIVEATGNFCIKNKLGHGGFGYVYKGVLPGNHNIAVKRLSRKSSQGVEEFKNETTLIAKLQHRNLVRLLGCCIHGEEKMLIYEYMPNKSLDSFLSDPAKRTELGWPTRFNIIEGIARGLLYLHRDSRLRIIHRDLKASNILLDAEMIPKISDFGMARIFGGHQNEANTNRIVGTYGYMAPEYAMEGLFSMKSDVYSFGILLLEVISGRMNKSHRSSEPCNLKSLAWDLWEKDKAVELIDPSIASSCNLDQIHRCIHIAMLCVQDSATHRPDMSSVVSMLESQNAAPLPLPKQPSMTSPRRFENEGDKWPVSHQIECSNDLTMSTIFGR